MDLISFKRKIFRKLSLFRHVLKYCRYLFTLLFSSSYWRFLDKQTNKKNNTEKWHEETLTKRQNERKIFHGNEKWERFNGILIKESRTTLPLRTSFPISYRSDGKSWIYDKVLYLKVLEIHYFMDGTPKIRLKTGYHYSLYKISTISVTCANIELLKKNALNL